MSLIVKICGLSTPETLDVALQAGADMVGFVFFPASPRHIGLETARNLGRLAKGRAAKVALTVDADDATLGNIVETLRPDMLQLHGRETVARLRDIKQNFGLPVMKAIAVENADDLAPLPGYAAVADRILFDARAPKHATRPGGLGAVFDWHVLEKLDLKLPFMVSGGLNAGNVAEAVRITHAGGVDVSSGVERAPGIKDPDLIRDFIRAARATEEVKHSMNQNSPKSLPNSFRSGPDERGHFGIFGGRFVAETLMPLILDLEKAYADAKADPAFQTEMNGYLKNYVGRPSPLYLAERLTEHLGGAKIYFKREELNHTGSHKVNNVLGQIMVARRMGKKRIIAETGAGQHGVATATLCARFGLDCVVYMGAVDVERQQPNVIRMEMLGAKVIPVQSGSRTLKDAMNEALRDWVTNVHDTFYCIGTVAGPHPYPTMVRDFQSIIGAETRVQMQEAEGRLPDSLIACIGGGSNAMGLFHPFLDDPSVEIFGVEAAGHGLTQLHAASIAGGRPGVLHGNRTYLLMDDDGQIQDAHSISAGLDYPGIGPEHSWLHETGRVTYLSATDDEALAAFQLLSRLEGIIPALEPAHAIAKVMELAPKRPKDHLMVVNLSGRGDKDVPQVGDILRGKKAMTTRIDARFAELKKQGRSAFVTYVMAGDPDPTTSLDVVKALAAAGADMIELGIPFTDPMADGPSIQAAGLRALKAGMTLSKTLEVVRGFRARDTTTPLVLMGYYNPIYIYGVDKFLTDAKSAGVDGLIIVDLPPEEDTELCLPAMKAGLNFIRLATPTTDDKRLPAVLANTSGFVYYVSITGITGSASADAGVVGEAVARIKRHTELPVCVGFGIRTPEAARAIAENANGAVVGTALVDALSGSLDAQGRATARTVGAVADLAASLAQGVRGAKQAAE